MTSISTELKTLLNEYFSQLNSLTEEVVSYKPSPKKWSKKELIGHLIDSAQNNIRRFIVTQYEDNPTIIYNQDNWVEINNYQEWDPEDLIRLWYLLNCQIVSILNNIPSKMRQRKCTTAASHTIEWLAEDYIKHFKYHMHQVLNLEPVTYP